MKNWTKKHIAISQTWDGQTIPSKEHIHLKLQLLEEELEISFTAPFYNDPAPPAVKGSFDGLWEYEVVEVFIAHQQDYTEIEFGPHGHYLVIKLSGQRNRIGADYSISYACEVNHNIWSGKAKIPIGLLPPLKWTYNAYSIHNSGEERTYLAAFPPGGQQPDFHQLDSFKKY